MKVELTKIKDEQTAMARKQDEAKVRQYVLTFLDLTGDEALLQSSFKIFLHCQF